MQDALMAIIELLANASNTDDIRTLKELINEAFDECLIAVGADFD